MSQHSEEQARAKLDHIVAMMAATEIDWREYERLSNDDELDESDLETLTDMGDIIRAAEISSEEELEETLDEYPLEVAVRSGWGPPPDYDSPMEAEEFKILLCTGGPAVRIIGELRNNQPYRAWLEHQDWGENWQQMFLSSSESETLLSFAQRFYYGD